MAIASISPAGLAYALRIDPPVDLDLSNLVDRLIAVTVSVCGEFSGPKTPVEVQDQAVILMSGYLFDSPESPPGTAWAASFRNCGAMSLLSPWKNRRAGALVIPDPVVVVEPDLRVDPGRPAKGERVTASPRGHLANVTRVGRSAYVSWPKTERRVWKMGCLIGWPATVDNA